MVAPLIAAAVRKILGSAVKQNVAKSAVSAAPRAAEKIAKQQIRQSRATAVKQAVAPVTKDIRAEATALGLRGQARRDYVRANHHRVVQVREGTKQQFDDVLAGAGTAEAALPAAVSKQVAAKLATGDVAGASDVVRASVAKTVRRELSDLRTGRRTGYGLEVEEGSRENLVEEVLAKVAGGQNITAASREVLVDRAKLRIRGGEITGQAAKQVADAAGEFNKMLGQVQNITNLPRQTQDRIMRRFFDKVDGKYVDADGNVWTPQDVEQTTSGVYPVNPADTSDPLVSIARAANPLRVAVEGHSGRKRSFSTSLTNGGMRDASPVLYADVMAKVNSMSPGALDAVVRTGVMGQYVTYFSSDRNALVANAFNLVNAVGLNPSNYSFDDMNW